MLYSYESPIDMYYNSTGVTYFNIPVSSTEVYNMNITDDTNLNALKTKIDLLQSEYLEDFMMPSLINMEYICSRSNYNYTYFILIFIVLILLLLLNLVIVIWKLYSIWISNTSKPVTNESVYYDSIIEKNIYMEPMDIENDTSTTIYAVREMLSESTYI